MLLKRFFRVQLDLTYAGAVRLLVVFAFELQVIDAYVSDHGNKNIISYVNITSFLLFVENFYVCA